MYDYVRRAYGVDPKLGQRVRHTEIDKVGKVARENKSQSHYVMVTFDGCTAGPLPCHPTALEYFAKGSA
jgi:hypothetical protein